MSNSLKKIREAKKFTLEKLAKESGVARSTIGHFENGKIEARQGVVQKLATALSVSAEEILRSPDVAAGGLDMGAQVLDEIRVRLSQFPAATPSARQLLAGQIAQRVEEYARWCSDQPVSPAPERAVDDA